MKNVIKAVNLCVYGVGARDSILGPLVYSLCKKHLFIYFPKKKKIFLKEDYFYCFNVKHQDPIEAPRVLQNCAICIPYMAVMCWIWGVVWTQPLPLKEATSKNKRYSLFQPSSNYGVLLWCCRVYNTSHQSKEDTHTHTSIFMADVTWVKWPKDLSAQRRWRQ